MPDPTRAPQAPPAPAPLRPPSGLAAITQQVEAIILARQDPHTGLLPASTAITVHGDYTHAWVRDNVYSILAVWALARAWRKLDLAKAQAYDDRVVALMRGLLAAMLRQAAKVERFKHTQHPLDALHAKYHTRSGEAVVGDADWGHLQLDATALFLLMLAMMSASGQRVVHTPEELALVQNLVYYLAKAYRTPDYGIWERGDKRNSGQPELNASSIGMAKAALEAMDGRHLLPPGAGGPGPAILVPADDIAHHRATLEGLLPRESASKQTDAALLAVVGFPAYAVDNAALAARTRHEVLVQLQGRYGCKRFLRDGHQTVVEDAHRLHYEPSELRQFEHIESEWPLFFTYLLVDACLRGDAASAADTRSKLDGLLQWRDGQALLPELYWVPAGAVEAERAAPHSQTRQPNDNLPLVWAQSLYLVGLLLHDGLVTPDDIDPLGRRHALAGAPSAPPLRMALLAEDALVQSRLSALGIASNTPEQLAPVQVRYAQDLEDALTHLGHCPTLGLTGRPRDGLGSLATAQVFTLGDDTLVFLPSLFNRPSFYLALDNRLLVDELQAEAAYIRRHWRGTGQPLLALLVTEPMLAHPGEGELVAFLQALVQGQCAGLDVGPLAAWLPLAQRRSIDWQPVLAMTPPLPAAPLASDDLPPWEEAATRPLTPGRAAALQHDADSDAGRELLARSRNPYEQVELIAALWRRYGADHIPLWQREPFGATLRQLAEALYVRAARIRRWGLLRRAAGLLGLRDESLEDAVAHMVLRGQRVSVGRHDVAEALITRPSSTAQIAARLTAHGGDDPRAHALIQETVLLLGTLVKADPALVAGTLTLRPWHLVVLVNAWLAREHGVSLAEAFDHLLELSPQAILARLREVMLREREMARELRRQRWLQRRDTGGALVRFSFPPSMDPPLDDAEGGWRAWRDLNGVLTRLPAGFHPRIWALLQHMPGLVIGDALDSTNLLDSGLLRSDTTAAEPAFALQVDDLLNKVHEPAYRQLSIEALLAVSDVCRANPSLMLANALVVDVLLATAVRWHAGQVADEADADATTQAWQAVYAMPPHQLAQAVAAALDQLMQEPTPEANAEVPADAGAAPQPEPLPEPEPEPEPAPDSDPTPPAEEPTA